MQVRELNSTQVFFHELGRFVSQFALAESMVFIHLMEILKVSKNDFNAVLSGTKMDGCVNYIKRIYEARGERLPELLQQSLDKLGEINKLRNDLLHRGARGENFTVTNELRAMSGRIEEYQINPKILGDAISDLSKAILLLHTSVEVGTFTSQEKQGMILALAQPWKYKSPSQGSQNQKNHKSAQEKSRPPSASRK